jgi:hypothetical protein
MTGQPQTALEKARMTAARSALGIKVLTSSDGFILGQELAFKDGALIVMRKIFGDAPVVVFAWQGSLSEAERKLFQEINAQLDSAGRPRILMASSLEEAKKTLTARLYSRGVPTPSLNLKAMANANESSAVLLREQLGDNAILVTSKRFRAFLDLAGVTALVESMQNAYFATARSA